VISGLARPASATNRPTRENFRPRRSGRPAKTPGCAAPFAAASETGAAPGRCPGRARGRFDWCAPSAASGRSGGDQLAEFVDGVLVILKQPQTVALPHRDYRCLPDSSERTETPRTPESGRNPNKRQWHQGAERPVAPELSQRLENQGKHGRDQGTQQESAQAQGESLVPFPGSGSLQPKGERAVDPQHERAVLQPHLNGLAFVERR